MKKTVLRSWMAVGSSVVFLPMALAASCSSSDASPYLDLTENSFKQVTLSGDVAHLKFNVPASLVRVDANGNLSASGQTEAVTLLARTTITDLASFGLVNNTFMPLPVLQAYLSGNLRFSATDRLEIIVGDSVTDVLNVYGSDFGFSRSNLKITKLGVWDANSFEIKFIPKANYKLAPSFRDTGKPDTSLLKNYVNLDLSAFSSQALASQFAYAATSVHNSVSWTKSPTIASMVPQWVAANHVANLKFTSSPTYTSDSLLSTPPTSFVLSPDQRRLYVVLSPEPNYVLSTEVVDVTAASGIITIPLLVDESPNYDALNLTGIKLNVSTNLVSSLPEAPYSSGQFALTLPNLLSIPTGASIRYSIDGKVWLDSLAIVDAIKGAPQASSYVLRAKLVASDAALYVVKNAHETVIQSALLGLVDTKSFFDRADQITVTKDATTASVLYNNLPVLTTTEASFFDVEYLVGDFATPALAQQFAAWKTAPDASVIRITDTRMYVRLKAKNGYVLSRTIADITTSSGVNKL